MADDRPNGGSIELRLRSVESQQIVLTDDVTSTHADVRDLRERMRELSALVAKCAAAVDQLVGRVDFFADVLAHQSQAAEELLKRTELVAGLVVGKPKKRRV